MERVVSRSRSLLVTITPAPDGWRVRNVVAGEPARSVATMEEVAAAIPAGAVVRLALPVGAVLMERMRLPTTDPGELAGMVVLQLEKTLPYSGDEMTSGFDIIGQEGSESDLIAIAASNTQLDTMCEPLHRARKLPDHVTVFAIQLAAEYPGDEVTAIIYREAETAILAIAQHGKLVAAHACAAADQEGFLEELPRILLAAELEGAPVNFGRAVVERELASWSEGIEAQLNVPVQLASLDGPFEPGPVNLVPAGWILEQRAEAQKAKVREWLALAGMIYLALLLAAAGYIIWLQHEVGAIDARVNATAPSVNEIATRKARWTALSAATDPARYTVEILQQINKTIPSEDLHVTIFDHTPAQFMVEGEAPTADMAAQYMESLRNNPDMKDFHFEAAQPEIVGAEQRAHFRIFGKL